MTEDVFALRAHELEVRYQRGQDPALRGVSLELRPSEGLLVTGASGAGKTTLVRALLGLVGVVGTVDVSGRRLQPFESPPSAGYAPQGRSFAGRLSPRALVSLLARLRGQTASEGAAEAALDRAGLARERHRGGRLDVDEVRRLSLACALVGDPALLVLDDPWEFPETFAEIDAARHRGAAVLVATAHPGRFAPLLGRSLVLEAGSPA